MRGAVVLQHGALDSQNRNRPTKSTMAPIPTPLTSLGSHADYDNTIGDSCSPRLLYLNWPAALNNGGQERAFA